MMPQYTGVNLMEKELKQKKLKNYLLNNFIIIELGGHQKVYQQKSVNSLVIYGIE